MGHGRIGVVLGVHEGLAAVQALCEEMRQGSGVANHFRNSPIAARVQPAEIFSTLNQLSQVLRLLQKEDVKISWGVLGAHSLKEMSPFLEGFQMSFQDSDYRMVDKLGEEGMDILVYVPIDVQATKHVDHLARLSLIAPRIRHVAFTQAPRWTHAQLLALRMIGPAEIGLFLVILTAGLVYAWKKGALEWEQ